MFKIRQIDYRRDEINAVGTYPSLEVALGYFRHNLTMPSMFESFSIVQEGRLVATVQTTLDHKNYRVTMIDGSTLII
jgi:hypothetical protein